MKAGPLFALYSTLIAVQNARNASDRTGRLSGNAQTSVWHPLFLSPIIFRSLGVGVSGFDL